MSDRLCAAERSEQMRRIRSRDTKPELLVRRTLHALGFRFRLHRRDLPGTPDIVLSKSRTVVFVHGCFWHQHDGCRLKRQPKSRLEYWLPKLHRNVVRDIEVRRKLADAGWSCLTVWECEVKDQEALTARLESFLAEALTRSATAGAASGGSRRAVSPRQKNCGE